MAKSITILVGTITGTAELVAEDVKPILEEAGYAVEILDMDGLTQDVLLENELVLICTSTYGQGDVPDNAMDFFENLDVMQPDLAGLRYGVIGLGDSTYADTYNQGGARFDGLLQELGAQRVGEVMAHNASSDELPEEAGVAWAKEWVKILA
ncbi:MAG: flavodoxin domain-containing protein [Alphaproteobacteria bacterium]|nr:flavodoxin domain-containing protein [Alphaproteobacteria bacterium]MDP6833254.1 flavodoxin domain-containing protein [Alphaproteobacteria bacterium]MDP6876264.1 flavodoxin domain-containing protein [Alphaproteobacteria bacterium]